MECKGRSCSFSEAKSQIIFNVLLQHSICKLATNQIFKTIKISHGTEVFKLNQCIQQKLTGEESSLKPKARNLLIKICNKNVNQVNLGRMGESDYIILLAPCNVSLLSHRKMMSR